MKLFYILMFYILGSVLASFYGVVATRLLRGESIVRPGSHCDKCKHPLKWYDLIPGLSFIILKGRCRYCKERLEWWTWVLEISLGIIFALSYYVYGLSYNFYMIIILSSLVVLIFVTDFKEMIILDSPLIISSILIFILKWYYMGLKSAFISIFNGIILFLFMLFIGFLGSKIFKREALGGGDIKLSYVIGASIGIPYGFIALVLSTFLALPYATYALLSTLNREVPFGPFLISATLIVFVFMDKFSYILKVLYM